MRVEANVERKTMHSYAHQVLAVFQSFEQFDAFHSAAAAAAAAPASTSDVFCIVTIFVHANILGRGVFISNGIVWLAVFTTQLQSKRVLPTQTIHRCFVSNLLLQFRLSSYREEQEKHSESRWKYKCQMNVVRKWAKQSN